MKEEKIESVLPTLDDFEKRILERPDNHSALQKMIDKVSDVYDGLPVLIRSLTNFDPTGVSGTIAQMLSENKAKREQKNIICALYLMWQTIMEYGDKLKYLELKEQLPALTESYFEFSKNTYQQSKIKFFRNIWLNGIIKEDKLDQKL